MKFDFESFTYDSEWLATAVEKEQESNWDGQIGPWAKQSATTPATPEQVKQMLAQMRLYSILFEELRFWIMSWNIGVAEEDALSCTKQVIIPHIQNPSAQLQSFFSRLLEEDASTEDPKPVEVRGQAIQQIKAILSKEDWNRIAQAASQSVQKQIMGFDESRAA